MLFPQFQNVQVRRIWSLCNNNNNNDNDNDNNFYSPLPHHRCVGNRVVKNLKGTTLNDILPWLRQIAGFDPQQEILAFEVTHHARTRD